MVINVVYVAGSRHDGGFESTDDTFPRGDIHPD